ncbi:hypothetical protein EDD29_7359 [Actinocorallia herbida]|uniref:DNA-binding protein n=1 Tax=Actinocorallia herbida TaxID=58109 RepID=A0A3N1D7Z7_9ACTN|nr:DNA-binding protein [Actinocorallia herbida]ROO89654.1 hypothetical protein EDD29_7359 [Actinocorallia herbida]
MSVPTVSRPSAGTAAELLAAGAYLPSDTADAGEGVPVTARAYQRAGLGGRTVVRLVPEEIGEAEDAAAAFLGLARVGLAEVVGFGVRERLAFPEWVLVHHPADGHHALGLLPEIDRLARLAVTKAKVASEGFTALGKQLATSVPHLLPTFYERAGREFLTVEKPELAARMFAAARKAETEHGLPIDEARLDDVFVEFALAGALPAKTLSEYAKALALRLPPDEALERFLRLAVRRAAGGLPPASTTAHDLRRLAKAASGEAGKIERDHLAEMLTYPATALAPETWWKAHRAALVELAAERPETSGVLLRIMPDHPDLGFQGSWLDLLEDTGAAALLSDEAGNAGPEDGVAGWLIRFLQARGPVYQASRRLPRLESMVGRMAGRLKAELAERGTSLPVPVSADLLDLLLELGVPVADPSPGQRAHLDTWAMGDGRRDLAALCADPRFARALHLGIAGMQGREASRQEALLAAVPLHPHLRAYVEELRGRVAHAGLPETAAALTDLGRLHPGVQRLAEEPVRAALAVDFPELLARTLRGGLFDEMSWPAFDTAVAELFPEHYRGHRTIAEEWPYLVVANRQRALVLDGSGIVLDHALRVPANTYRLGFRYVDGALLVQWSDGHRGVTSGYWHTLPDRVLRLEGDSLNGYDAMRFRGDQKISLAAPGGGSLTGSTVLHRGDALAPDQHEIASDGKGYWARRTVAHRPVWHALDPVTGAVGEPDLPAFFAEPGESFRNGFLAPFPGTGTTPVGAVVDGVLGQRTVVLPDGAVRGEDLAGNASPAVRGHGTVWQVRLPGDDKARAVLREMSYGRSGFRLIGPDGLLLADSVQAAHFRAGSGQLPPLHYWAHLTPRDPRGSAALRRADRDVAVRLLEGGDTEAEIAARVRAALPDLAHDALVAGVAGVVAAALAARKVLAGVREKAESAFAPGAVEELPASPTDVALFRGLDGLGEYASRPRGTAAHSAHLLWKLGRLYAGAYAARSSDGEAAPRVALPDQNLHLPSVVAALAGVALRAVSETTPEDARSALRELFGLLGEAGLLAPEPDAWRILRLRPADQLEPRTDHLYGSELAGGGFFAVTAQRWNRFGQQNTLELQALCHDPSGAFEAPADYAVTAAEPLVAARPDVPVAEILALLDARGPAPWRPDAVAEFGRLTGVTPTTAALVVAGLPGLSGSVESAPPAEFRRLLKAKVADLDAAQEGLRKLSGTVRRELVGALLPADPARLWTEGPDVAAAAEVWNRAVPRRIAVPEALLTELAKDFGSGRLQAQAQAVLDPSGDAGMSQDVEWRPESRTFEPLGNSGFTARTLNSSVRILAWLAHRLPVGDPLRALLPEGLAAVRERLANPGLVLRAEPAVYRAEFKKAAGAPDEEGPTWERYGPVLLLTDTYYQRPGVKVALLDENGDDPRLALLRGSEGAPMPFEVAMRVARDARFAALLDDPGEPVDGGTLKDGTWYPQDPSRSVPELVAEAAARFGLSADAAAVYLMLLAMPDPTDRNTARWTGWRPARLKEARAELTATDLVVEARRTRANRTLFLPCPWTEVRSPQIPMEDWKQELYLLFRGGRAPLTNVLPTEPVTDVYRRAWRRIAEGDLPRFGELEIPRQKRRR